MLNLISLILSISDFISIILNNVVSLIVYPINLLANILYQIGERVGLIEEEEPQTVEQLEDKEQKIGFQIMSNKTSVE